MKKARERIYFDLQQLESIEIDILNRRHIERYTLVRQFLYGTVLDVSCGCGYGTYSIAKNPDVKNIIGIDIDKGAINWANKHFLRENCIFEQTSIEDFTKKADILVSIETIEHLEKPEILNDLAERCEIKEIYVSYPSKKTTHYNKFHYRDFIDDEIIRIFKNYKLKKVFDLHNEVRILKLQRYVSSI